LDANIYNLFPTIVHVKKEEREFEEEKMRKEIVGRVIKDLGRIGTKEQLDELFIQKEAEQRLYLKRVMDYVKWTSTIAVAAILWVGNSIVSAVGLRLFLVIIGLGALVFSLGCSVYAASKVLIASRKHWELAEKEWDHCMLSYEIKENPSPIIKKELKRSKTNLIKAYMDVIYYLEPSTFTNWIDRHFYSLLGGLTIYAFSQVLGLFSS
jgi:hypothetical protein